MCVTSAREKSAPFVSYVNIQLYVDNLTAISEPIVKVMWDP
jgi:hypothetical protein